MLCSVKSDMHYKTAVYGSKIKKTELLYLISSACSKHERPKSLNISLRHGFDLIVFFFLRILSSNPVRPKEEKD